MYGNTRKAGAFPAQGKRAVAQLRQVFRQPAGENLNSRRETKEAGQACVPRKKYELPRGAISLPRKEQGRANHRLSVGEPGVCFIFFQRNICLPSQPHNLKARHPRPQSVTPSNTKAHKENHDRKNY